MALDKVVKVEILCHRANRREVLSIIEESGMVHLMETDAGEATGFAPVTEESLEELRELRAKTERAIQFLTGRGAESRKRDSLVTREGLERVFTDPGIRRTVDESVGLSGSISEAEQTIRELEVRINFVETWAGLPCRFDLVGRKGSFTVLAGTLPGLSKEIDAMREEFDLAHFQLAGRDMFACAVHSSQAIALEDRLSSLGFIPGEFQGLTGSPPEELTRLREELGEAVKTLEGRKARAEELAEHIADIKTLFDATGLMTARYEAATGGCASRSVLALHAWIREKDAPVLRSDLEKLAAAGMEVVEPRDGETPPVFLSENPAVDPYLLLTDMFGRPAEGDPDPTPLFAPFYALFFGICIGDAGYGIALAIGSALGVWLTKRREGNPRLFSLVFQGGLASILAGVFLGDWFGMDFNSLPAFLQAPPMLLNRLVPGYQPGQPGFSVSNQFLYLTLGLGLLQLTWGVLVNLGKRLKQGEGFSAVLEQGGWVLAIIGLFPWLFNRYLLNGVLYDISGPADTFFLYLLAAGAFLIFIMGGKSAGNLGGRIGLGAYAAYGIVNLLGDMLSYSRLFALALSSAIIAQVINEIAGMIAGSVAGIGVVLAVLVLVAGHLFNMAMAVLSGFIHTARLQFVEFFGKFYDGTGVPFSPCRYQPRFVRIGKSR